MTLSDRIGEFADQYARQQAANDIGRGVPRRYVKAGLGGNLFPLPESPGSYACISYGDGRTVYGVISDAQLDECLQWTVPPGAVGRTVALIQEAASLEGDPRPLPVWRLPVDPPGGREVCSGRVDPDRYVRDWGPYRMTLTCGGLAATFKIGVDGALAPWSTSDETHPVWVALVAAGVEIYGSLAEDLHGAVQHHFQRLAAVAGRARIAAAQQAVDAWLASIPSPAPA